MRDGRILHTSGAREKTVIAGLDRGTPTRRDIHFEMPVHVDPSPVVPPQRMERNLRSRRWRQQTNGLEEKVLADEWVCRRFR